jgi:pimeloyl-ACP methyl ester carboxylesterase
MKDSSLRAHFRMVSIDRPGYGGSEDAGPMHLKDQSDHLVPILHKLAVHGPLLLAGHSLGGPAIVQLAADDPQDIACIVLLAGSVSPEYEGEEAWRNWFSHFPLKLLLPGAVRPSNVELLYFKDDVKGLASDFPKVTCDVRIVHGDQDPMVPPGNVDYARKNLVNARSVTVQMLPGANHFIPWTRTTEISKTLLDAGTMYLVHDMKH